jgi:hypothetical protein
MIKDIFETLIMMFCAIYAGFLYLRSRTRYNLLLLGVFVVISLLFVFDILPSHPVTTLINENLRGAIKFSALLFSFILFLAIIFYPDIRRR